MRKVVHLLAIALAACIQSDDGIEPQGDVELDESAITAGVWSTFTTTANTLTVSAAEPLVVNSPFFGIEVRRNGVDITDDIVGIETTSTTSWRYTFATQKLNTPGDQITISLQNRVLGVPGHYIAVRTGQQVGNPVESTYAILSDCEAGVGQCAGDGPRPGLMAAVKGLSQRYMPRDIETAPGVYDFSRVFADAKFLAARGMKLHIIFTVKSFATDSLFDGDGVTKSFPVPARWDKGRAREIHVYVGGVEKPYTFNATRTQVVLASAPPTGNDNVNVVHARDPFPEYAWHMSPPIGGWYVGPGGPHTGPGGSHGFVHAPWRATCVEWMRNFMAAFQAQWTAAIAADPSLARAIESVSHQETANALGGTGYTEQAYRAGLEQYAKFTARAVRRRAVFGQLLNQIPGGNANGALALLANAIVPWGARLEGPDLFNDEPSLEDKVYQWVHRDLHTKAVTMIWHQNASYVEDKAGGGMYSPAQQFEKARLGVADTNTPSGTPGLEAEYVFWNMTVNNGAGHDWKDALPVIAANPDIRPWGNHRYRWRRASDGVPLVDQSLSRVIP